MLKFIFLGVVFLLPTIFIAQTIPVTPFEKDPLSSATHDETIAFYRQMADNFEAITLKEVGLSDVGRPIHMAVLANQATFTAEESRAKGKAILFINNAIHPGEPCGVDATMLLVKDILTKPQFQQNLDKITIVIIPFYNIGGGLNRNSTTRVNQNGPKAYGFRGNAQHLDLNRDFIKCDSRNARTFNEVYTQWMPDVFIDNHTSNGADYQYNITLIATQHNKLEPNVASYLNETMLPYLYQYMKVENWEMTPYVNARTTPDKGIAGFLDLPRYSSGYAAMYNAFSFMPEAHMLKPFENRVKSTYTFMKGMIHCVAEKKEAILTTREKARVALQAKTSLPINWALDPGKKDSLLFKGYEAKFKKSAVTGLDRMYYDQSAPFEKMIPYFNHFKATKTIEKPVAYILPQSAHRVVERMQWNHIDMRRLSRDTEAEVEIYYIKDYQTSSNAYEGHYLHSEVRVETRLEKVRFYQGDFVIYTNQPAIRYIIETLEPEGPDSFFAWNFFDGILQRKEYFSSYVFEDLAAELLEKDPSLQQQLAEMVKADSTLAKSSRRQLEFIYDHSEHAEKNKDRYPIGRLVKWVDLPLK